MAENNRKQAIHKNTHQQFIRVRKFVKSRENGMVTIHLKYGSLAQCGCATNDQLITYLDPIRFRFLIHHFPL